MGTTSKIHQQHFHGEHREQLLLTCGETGCVAEITVLGIKRSRLTAEVLVQPRDSRGLPLGPVVEVCSTEIDLLPVPGRGRLVGRFWLPGPIRWPTAMNCYFRLSSIRITTNASDPTAT
ncbi:MAG: hypothetical protein KDB01_20165 [Planctomycetaceae bacterium]|nr:hypothetical protein [Planctomycetaceae bacterium]